MTIYYKIPLAMIEGKWIYKGDTLYEENRAYVIDSVTNSLSGERGLHGIDIEGYGRFMLIKYWTLEPVYPKKEMNPAAKHLIWFGITIAVSMFASVLIHPAVLVGVVIGVTIMTLKQIHEEK